VSAYVPCVYGGVDAPVEGSESGEREILTPIGGGSQPIGEESEGSRWCKISLFDSATKEGKKAGQHHEGVPSFDHLGFYAVALCAQV